MVTDMEVDENIVEQFLEESNEHLRTIEDSLLKLEDNPSDLEEINKVFRAMHSIKGGGQMFGYADIGTFAHEFETFFEFVRKGTLTLNPESISLTLNACDLMKKMFSAQVGDEAVDESAMLIECLRDLYVSTEKNAIFAKKSDTVFWVKFIPQIDIFSSGIDVIEILEECHHIGRCEIELDIGDIPLLDEMDPAMSYFSWTMITTSADGIEPIQCIFLFIDEAKATLKIEPITPDTVPADETVKRLFARYQQQGSQPESVALPSSPIQASSSPSLPVKKLSTEATSPPASPDEIANVKVPFQKLDKLVNLVGELITVKDQLSQYSQTHSDVELMLISGKVENLSWELR
ncbi:MAG: Hpt domain-containing protein, partial [Candidatus Margulisiibacteriota bacterium]